jgi:hypothetical protein
MMTGQQSLFDEEDTSTALGMRALAETAAKHAADIAALVPLARELAHRAGPDGITVSDLRLYAVQRGLLTGEERGRQLSYLGKVMSAAGLMRTGGYRRSAIRKAHGNLGAVWRLP